MLFRFEGEKNTERILRVRLLLIIDGISFESEVGLTLGNTKLPGDVDSNGYLRLRWTKNEKEPDSSSWHPFLKEGGASALVATPPI